MGTEWPEAAEAADGRPRGRRPGPSGLRWAESTSWIWSRDWDAECEGEDEEEEEDSRRAARGEGETRETPRELRKRGEKPTEG